MRLALTLGRVDDKWDVIGAPSSDVIPHKELFRKIALDGGKVGKNSYHEIRTFTTDGILDKRRVFDTDTQRKAHAARVAADIKTYEAAKKKREEEAKKPVVKTAINTSSAKAAAIAKFTEESKTPEEPKKEMKP